MTAGNSDCALSAQGPGTWRQVRILEDERDLLRSQLRWLMGEFPDYLGTISGEAHIPRHYCEFEHNPPAGGCEWHERWCDAAQTAGLMDEWAEEAIDA